MGVEAKKRGEKMAKIAVVNSSQMAKYNRMNAGFFSCWMR